MHSARSYRGDWPTGMHSGLVHETVFESQSETEGKIYIVSFWVEKVNNSTLSLYRLVLNTFMSTTMYPH